MLIFLEGTCVSGDAHPFTTQVDPGIGESPIMIEGFTFIQSFSVVGYSGIGADIVMESISHIDPFFGPTQDAAGEDLFKD